MVPARGRRVQGAGQGAGTTGVTTTFDAELTPGARNAVRVCLNVQPHERVTVVTDRACQEIAASLVHEIEAVGAPYRAFVLEDEAPRPLTALPESIAADMHQSQVSVFAVEVQQHELASRMQLTAIVNQRRMRHAHMVNITPQIMREGMRADYLKVDRLSQKVIEMVRTAHQVRATTPAGSNFTATLNPDYKWLKTSGLISPDKWGNLPGGEIFTTPGEVNGTLVVDGVVGDFLCARFGMLTDSPLTLEIVKPRHVGPPQGVLQGRGRGQGQRSHRRRPHVQHERVRDPRRSRPEALSA